MKSTQFNNSFSRLSDQFRLEVEGDQSSPFRNLLTWFVLFFGIASCLPLLITTVDLWDGVINTYAADTGRPEIFSTWYEEAGWLGVDQLYSALYYFSEMISIDLKVIINIIVFSSVVASGFEIFYLSHKVYKVPTNLSLLGVLFFFVAPFIPLYISSVFLMHALAIYLCLLGTRLYLTASDNQHFKTIVGFLLVALSFEHNSNPTLFFFLMVIAYLVGGRRNLLKDGLVLVSLAIIFLAYKNFSVPFGLYSGYNKTSLSSIFNLSSWKTYVDYFLHYYSVIPLVALLLFLQDPKKGLILWGVIFSLLFLVLPYVSVAKFPLISDINNSNGWSQRFIINLYVGICVSFPLIIYYVVRYTPILTGVFTVLAGLFMFSQVAEAYYFSYSSKAKSVFYSYEFTDALQELEKPEPGNVYVRHGAHNPSYYETNSYFYNAYGIAAWMNVSSMEQRSIGSTFRFQKYKDKYILSDYSYRCTTGYFVDDQIDKISRFDLLFGLYSKLYQDNAFQAVEIVPTGTDCVNSLGEY